MMPGYEILFFWVARMILMSGVLLGDIPFNKVILHGMVRDKQGRKFSKSLNNGVDPLDMIDLYGADALRMALVYGSAMGSDVNFDEQRVRGMKHFSNKLWNMGRFIYEFKPENYSEKISDRDTEIIEKVNIVAKKTTKLLDSYRLHEAAQLLYDFSWHEFADLYIEEAKERREESQETLEKVYLTLLKLLHPFMPFITEELFGKFTGNKLITSEWPST